MSRPLPQQREKFAQDVATSSSLAVGSDELRARIDMAAANTSRKTAETTIKTCGNAAVKDLEALIADAIRSNDDARVTDLDRILRKIEQIMAVTVESTSDGHIAA